MQSFLEDRQLLYSSKETNTNDSCLHYYFLSFAHQQIAH